MRTLAAFFAITLSVFPSSLIKFVAIGITEFAFLAHVKSSFGAQVKPVQGMRVKSCTAKTAEGTTIKGTIKDEGGALGEWCEGKDNKGNTVSVQCGKDNKRCTIQRTMTPAETVLRARGRSSCA